MTLLHEVTNPGVSTDCSAFVFKGEEVLEGRIEKNPQLHLRENLKHHTIYLLSTTYSSETNSATALHRICPNFVRPQVRVSNCNVVEDFTVHHNRCENAILSDGNSVIKRQSVNGHSQLG